MKVNKNQIILHFEIWRANQLGNIAYIPEGKLGNFFVRTS